MPQYRRRNVQQLQSNEEESLLPFLCCAPPQTFILKSRGQPLLVWDGCIIHKLGASCPENNQLPISQTVEMFTVYRKLESLKGGANFCKMQDCMTHKSNPHTWWTASCRSTHSLGSSAVWTLISGFSALKYSSQPTQARQCATTHFSHIFFVVCIFQKNTPRNLTLKKKMFN